MEWTSTLGSLCTEPMVESELICISSELDTKARIPVQVDYFGGKENTGRGVGKWDQKAGQRVCGQQSSQVLPWTRRAWSPHRNSESVQSTYLSGLLRDQRAGVFMPLLPSAIGWGCSWGALIPCPCHKESQRQPTTKIEKKKKKWRFWQFEVRLVCLKWFEQGDIGRSMNKYPTGDMKWCLKSHQGKMGTPGRNREQSMEYTSMPSDNRNCGQKDKNGAERWPHIKWVHLQMPRKGKSLESEGRFMVTWG